MVQHRKPTVWTFLLYQEGDQERIAELSAALRNAEARAQSGGVARWGDDSPSVEAATQKLQDFIADVADRTFEIKWRAIGSRRFRDLRLKHPPRMVMKPGEDGEPVEVVHEDDD